MNWLSGGVLFLVGAALWVAYLLPSMLRRREQHNLQAETVRLQHALQTLAETGQLPIEEQPLSERIAEHKRLHKIEAAEERENLRALQQAEEARKAEAKAQHRAARFDHKHDAAVRRSVLVRRRMVASWMLLLSVLLAIGGTVGVFFDVTWMVAGAGVMGIVISAVLLRQVVHGLAQLGVQPREAATAVGQAFVPVEFAGVAATAASRSWQPQPLPTPLHLAEGSQAAATISSQDALEALRRRAREVAAELATAPRVPSVTTVRARVTAVAAHSTTSDAQLRTGRPQPARPVARAAAAPAAARVLSAAEQVAQRYVHMSALPDTDAAAFDVSEVLQRRRAV